VTQKHDPASKIKDLRVKETYGGVNPSITDSSTYTFSSPKKMAELFEEEIEGCFLYSRHFNPINKSLCAALSTLEGTESAQVTASGMGAITSAILQLCGQGDEIVSSWTIYGGTYAFFANFLPRFGITVKFVDMTDQQMVAEAITERTKVLYCESISNPLLEIPNIPQLSKLAKSRGLALVVDNTFAPYILSPARHGADIVAHSLTKFINGSSDCVAGALCSTKAFINQVTDINAGACMLLGPVLDSLRSSSILKNIHTLHLRMRQHSRNAQYVAERLHAAGVTVHYPGLKHHPQHELMKTMMDESYGFGGMLVVDTVSDEKAGEFMSAMQDNLVGYLAVSLGYFKTLFSAPASSTSSEIPEEVRKKMGLSHGMVRLSVGLDNDIEQTFERIQRSLKQAGMQ
jgi:methionine-gamma-lyase